jgi:hypothetical protein
MKKYIFCIVIIFILASILGFNRQTDINVNSMNNVNNEQKVDVEQTNEINYSINVDTVTQGEISFKKLVIHNKAEYDNNSLLSRSKELLEKVKQEKDITIFGEVNIIFYKNGSMFAVVDTRSWEIFYL